MSNMEFLYKARTNEGEVVEDKIEAESRHEAISELRASGFTPISVVEKKSNFFDFGGVLANFSRVTLIQKISFLKNLSVMIKAGVAIPRALGILSAQTEEGKLKRILSDMAKDVQIGKSISETMEKNPTIFGPLYVNMIRVGESGGNLDKSIDYLVGYLKRDYELLKKTKGAMTYPIVVFFVLILVVIIMFTFILPKLTDTFVELDVELPLLTRGLIALVDGFSSYSYIIFPGLILLIFLARMFFKSTSGRATIHKFNITAPLIKKATLRLNLSRFTLTLSSLLNSGMPIVEALNICGKSMTNDYYSKAILDSAKKVKGGMPLSDALKKFPDLFPNLTVQMIRVGEESGTMDNILKELNSFYEEELDQFVKNLSSIIEPIMVVFIGSVVAILALALITPIYSISQNV